MTKLTKLQHEILVGVLLGDASLQTESNGRTYRLRISQSEQHKDYLFHLYEKFKNLTDSPPVQYKFVDLRNPGKIYTRWSFSTTQQSCFRFYAQQFYGDPCRNRQGNGTEKKVPKLIHRWLRGKAIAYWYMDDGAQKWKGKSLAMRFCTDNFTKSDVQLLGNVFKQKFKLKTSLQKQRDGWRIYISSYSYQIIKDLIFDDVELSMRYKFPQRFN